MENKKNQEPTKPWRARQASGGGRVDWVVMGQCPLHHESANTDGDQTRRPFDQCRPDCEACNCRHCEGDGEHLIVQSLTETEARRAADLANRAELDEFLLLLGDRFVWYPHSITSAHQQGIARRVIQKPDSEDHITVFPSYAKNAETD